MTADQQRALVAFAKAIIRRDAWGDFSVTDAGDLQDTAAKYGLLVEQPYDPELHGENDYGVEPGDQWFVFAPWLEHQ